MEEAVLYLTKKLILKHFFIERQSERRIAKGSFKTPTQEASRCLIRWLRAQREMSNFMRPHVTGSWSLASIPGVSNETCEDCKIILVHSS